jgi:hypothetical protein
MTNMCIDRHEILQADFKAITNDTAAVNVAIIILCITRLEKVRRARNKGGNREASGNKMQQVLNCKTQ